MSNAPVFRDAALQRRYEEFGYVSFPLLSPDVVRTISESYSRMNLEDKFGIGYKVSLYSADLETRRQAREFLVNTAFPALDAYLVDRYPYMATYLVKEPDGRSIPAHQDWSHCDETKHDSIMCWIPLCDVDEHNGGLGFVNGSHRYFDYLRVFPYSVAKTPVDCHGMRLLPYLNILPMRAGEVVVFNNRVIHGSLPNSRGERRTALSFALHPKGEPLLAYYLKPGAGAKVALRYQATPEFYLEYPNPKMVELYARGIEIQGYASEEIPYELPTVEWETLAAKLQATGNRMDPAKVPQARELAGTGARRAQRGRQSGPERVTDRFKGRVAAVTGGASGIGRAVALRFVAEGGSVVVADLNETTGAETLALAGQAGHTRMRFVRTDVAEEASIEQMVARAVGDFGRLDCLVNNAGIGGVHGSVMKTAVEDWDYTYGVLARGVFLGIKHGARAMVDAGIEGSIVNIASVAGMSGGDAPIAYSSAKAAVINMTMGAAVELAQYRIRVNCVCPGAIVTPLLQRGLPADPEPVLRTLQPWGEPGRPEDLAGAALFLASDDARFVTGTTLVVDGGLRAAGPRMAARLNAWRASAGAPAGTVGVDRGSTGQGSVLRDRT